MGIPGIVPGGITIDGATSTSSPSKGVFAEQPGATLKYAINDGKPRDAEYRETLARLFIQMGEQERVQFVQSVPPETRALAQVLCGVGTGASGGTGFVDFILTQAVEPFQEKVQVVETLSDNFVVYLFGQSAPQFQYSGVLLNTYQDDQRVWMTRLYRDILRGTQLARRRKVVRLRYDSVIVSGIFIALQQGLMGDQENSVQFSFTMIPMQYVIFTPPVGVPTRLETPFTPAGDYALQSTAEPATKQLRATAPSRPPVPTKKMSTDKTPDQFVEENLGDDETAAGKLKKRTDPGESFGTDETKDVYGGKVPKE